MRLSNDIWHWHLTIWPLIFSHTESQKKGKVTEISSLWATWFGFPFHEIHDHKSSTKRRTPEEFPKDESSTTTTEDESSDIAAVHETLLNLIRSSLLALLCSTSGKGPSFCIDMTGIFQRLALEKIARCHLCGHGMH